MVTALLSRDWATLGGGHDGSAIQSKGQAIEQAEAGSQSGAKGQEKEKKSELSSMGERSSKFSAERNAKRQSE
jgi:hypothetical protein